MALRGFGLQRWRARKRIKGRGKTRRGLSKTGTADRECNVEHMQAAADSNGRENWRGSPGLATERKREKKKENWRRRLGRKKKTGVGPTDSEELAGENKTERNAGRETNAQRN